MKLFAYKNQHKNQITHIGFFLAFALLAIGCSRHTVTDPDMSACTTDEACGAGKVCDPDTGTCVQCYNDPDGVKPVGCDVTGPTPVCDDMGVCVACEADAEGGGLACSWHRPECIPSTDENYAGQCVRCYQRTNCGIVGSCNDLGTEDPANNVCSSCSIDSDGTHVGCDIESAAPTCNLYQGDPFFKQCEPCTDVNNTCPGELDCITSGPDMGKCRTP